MPARSILILGGTHEASAIARALAARPDTRVVTSLAGRTREPLPVAGEVRTGGFGGAEGLAAYLAAEGIDVLVDATHPFAARISENAGIAAERAAVRRLVFIRPPWKPQAGDDWHRVPTIEAAAAALPAGAHALLALGSQHLAAFSRRNDCRFLVRMVDAPDTPPPLARHTLLTGRPPREPADEAARFRAHGITHVVCRNSGGAAAAAKLVAARMLGLPVIMIDRPAPIMGETFETVDALLAAIG